MQTHLLSQDLKGYFYASSRKNAYCFLSLIAVLGLIVNPAFVKALDGVPGQETPGYALANLPPVAVCISTPLLVYLDEYGTAEISASQLDGGSYDPEMGPLTFLTRAVSYTCSDIGPQERALIVLDNTGQSDECTATVIIADNIPPVARCKNITVMPDNNGDYHLQPSDIEFGSSDVCGIKSMSVSPAFVPCVHESAQQLVTLIVTDSSGNSGTCTSYVQFLGDSDCDGVGDLCDQCPGGNDQIDNNNDGFPDCAIFPGKANIPDEWYCGNKCNQKVLICHIPPGNPENRHTICVSINAVPAHLAHGDYLGPCDDVSCARDTRSSESKDLKSRENGNMFMYPNPASDKVYLNFGDNAGKQASINISNKFGRVVYNRKFEVLPEGDYLILLDGYDDGLYFVKITGNDISEFLKLQVSEY